VSTNSTSAAAEAVSKGELDAAIASSAAAEHFNLEVRQANIGDNVGAVTRFICAQKPGWIPEPTGNDRTSIAVFIDIDHAGALLEILQVFANNDVNLTFIQSRPTGRELGHYHFIIDVEGHIQDEPVGKSIEELRVICDDIRFLGSYPREVR
jgi:prephenate dehydratase